ncbi:MAG: transglutaminase [Polyangiaceae bacterium]|nr:transglutaminase [Polyangiaceae bacterium]
MAPKPGENPAKKSVLWAVLGTVLKGLWTAFVVLTPVLGAWVASSLAAHANGPIALSAASGLLAFPILPLLWEAWVETGRRKKKNVKPHILTFLDRLVLRTLAVNILFLGILLGTQPKAAFAALSTRGDWMLDKSSGESAQTVRKKLFWAADRLEWLYLAFHDNPFDQKDDLPNPTGSSTAGDKPVNTGTVPSPTPTAGTTASNGSTDKPTQDKPTQDKPTQNDPGQTSPANREFATTKWPPPLPKALHFVVADMPRDAETSIRAVAEYIAQRESDPAGRFRAAHDWVADRIAYDGPSYVAHKYPPQDAETVFRTRTGVCAGYSKLLAALGRALGLEVEYVVGDARGSGDSEQGESHAWNAVKIGDQYYLADATWNSGYLNGSTFTKNFRTDYLFTPPHVFGLDHFPNLTKWQLRSTPITRGDFFRQAMMTPRFYAEGRELLSPTRSQVTVSGPFTAEIKTPPGLFTLASWTVFGQPQRTHCETENGTTARVTCNLPAKGKYTVMLFSSEKQYGQFDYIGQFEANRE